MTSPANSLFDQDVANSKLFTLQRRLPKELYRLHFQEICQTTYFSPYGWEEGEQDKRITIRLKKVSDDTVFFSLNIYRELGEFIETVSGVDIYKWYLLADTNTGETLRIHEVEGRIDRPEGLHFSLPIVELDLPDTFDVLVLQAHIEVDAYYDQDSDLYKYQRVPFSASSGGVKANLEIEYTHTEEPGRFGWHGLPEESKGLGEDCPPVHTCDVLSPYTHVLWEVDSITIPRSRINEAGSTITQVEYNGCNATKSLDGLRPATDTISYVASTTADGFGNFDTEYTVSSPPSDDDVNTGLLADVAIAQQVISSDHEDYPEDAEGTDDMVKIVVEITLDGPFSTDNVIPSAYNPLLEDPFDTSSVVSTYPPGSPGLGNTRELIRDRAFTFPVSSNAGLDTVVITLEKVVAMYQSTDPPTTTLNSTNVVSYTAGPINLCDGYEVVDTGGTESEFGSEPSEPQNLEWPRLWLQRTWATYDPTQVAITIKKNTEYPA